MFTYFHQHKFSYDKGQIAPLMILVLVVLIIMSMVTVNLYKVAMDKTYSANSVDAGALAAGTVMANTFNAIASSNAEMKKGYELAYYSMAGSVSLAIVYLVLAEIDAGIATLKGGIAVGKAYPDPSGAMQSAQEAAEKLGKSIESLPTAQELINGLIVSVSALYAAQLYFYGKLRETAEESHESAIEQGHKFLFYNSGVASRLPESIPEGSSWSRSREDFSRFLDGITYASTYRFDWVDGQGREHFAESAVTTEELDTFDLIVTMMPFHALWGALIACRSMAMSASVQLPIAVTLYESGASLCVLADRAKNCCENCSNPYAQAAACAAWVVLSSAAEFAFSTAIADTAAAIGLMTGTCITLGIFIAGLLPNRRNPVEDDNMGFTILNFVICWIDDIIHDRRLRVESTLSQQGGDLGLVETEYPLVQSYSVVDFSGSGKIVPTESADLSFDASIVETDVVGGSQ